MILQAGSTTTNVTEVGGRVDAAVDSGQFTAHNVRASLSVHGSSSTVIANGVSGAATLDLQSAQATLGMTSAQDVSASISSGSVAITVPLSAYHVVSTTSSGELDSTVPDSPAGAHRITLTLDSAQASLNYGLATGAVYRSATCLPPAGACSCLNTRNQPRRSARVASVGSAARMSTSRCLGKTALFAA